MSRPARITLTALAAVAFLLVSFGVAQALSARGAERSLLEKVITDQAKGRTEAVAAEFEGCVKGCADRIGAIVSKVAVPDRKVLLLQIEQGSPLVPIAGDGVARVAWRSEGHLPVIECIVTRRGGNVVSGFDVTLHAMQRLSDPEGSCPSAEAIESRF